ncbi:olfactory receptor 11L1 [Xenopus laevis]|uniref:Olfactory receptor n=2 Tax=Xenopus laevis TaxID=8355 RepID=A0A974DVV0_XENLA|nr:olfactory receptor 11L1 [Xenopus laevis]OCT98201.1 hypothetical protein XELAEV_18010431mg [Xenopus laevis]
MLSANETMITEFLLLGFKSPPSVTMFTFILFLVLYIIIISGNLLIILLVSTSRRLHSPMYFFLGNLSLSEITFTTNIVPNMLQNLLCGDGVISLAGCFTQYYFFSSTASTECLLLAVMSYDRYLAICNPLRYASLMHSQLCAHLVIWSWSAGFIISMITLILLNRYNYCGPNAIDNFFCDLTPLIQLACSDTFLVEIESFIFASILTLLPFIFILLTYIVIIYNIIKIPSTSGRKKAFSTCSSHLAVVSTYYGTLIAMYVIQSPNQLYDVNRVLSLLYTVVTPVLNPIVYSLRNQDFHEAIRAFLRNVRYTLKS